MSWIRWFYLLTIGWRQRLLGLLEQDGDIYILNLVLNGAHYRIPLRPVRGPSVLYETPEQLGLRAITIPSVPTLFTS